MYSSKEKCLSNTSSDKGSEGGKDDTFAIHYEEIVR